MSALKFSLNINAPAAKVWEALWNDTNYRKWTSVFMEGSYAESDWQEGHPIRFLGPNNSGMSSVIERLVQNEEMVFKHLSEIKNGVEETKDWAGARESYLLSEKDGTTTLDVQLDSVGNMDQYFNDTFPKALEIVKQIAEK